MYAATVDPYCYPGTTVLRNIPGLRDVEALALYETAITAQRGEEILPAGRLTLTHYQALHHHLFQDVFRWAGRFRTVRISKGGSMFCYPENIPARCVRCLPTSGGTTSCASATPRLSLPAALAFWRR